MSVGIIGILAALPSWVVNRVLMGIIIGQRIEHRASPEGDRIANQGNNEQ